jgi:hypothetical protein
MKTHLLLLAPLLFATTAVAAAPAGFKPAPSKHGECETVVPAAWGPGVAGIGLKAPSGASDILVSFKPGTLATEAAGLAGVYKITKTFESSAARYWVEYQDGPGSTRHWYVATPAGASLCTAILDFDASLSEGDARTIATSLKKH